ncbi:hypothetical protein LNKW23_39350 [Paralimibaculum aggregatum]|uniref:DUF2065 domain-containing protein n=1 Tax=Paralimibaculum aggregatum TaxID=3036245 RepID=A0ABQ6LS33_9RHOB|nr:DUF2065 family protein [Limibaculum sp. NKW23]GMG84719.1 hypothetical protein LNKW23_39350 [Limibaculum sp. NKW23]
MSGAALEDLAAALGLLLVLEGLALAFLGPRLGAVVEALRAAGSERLRWAGLAMAVGGMIVYLLVRE